MRDFVRVAVALLLPTLAAPGLARADEPLTTLLVPHPLTTPDPLAAPDPLSAPYHLSTDSPLSGDRPLLGTPAQRDRASPCPPPPRQAPLVTAGSGPGEFTRYMPQPAGSATPTRAPAQPAPEAGTDQTGPDQTGADQTGPGRTGIDRPLWAAPGTAAPGLPRDRPLWGDTPRGTETGAGQDRQPARAAQTGTAGCARPSRAGQTATSAGRTTD